jgi:AraC-like DNA-binding protein
MLSGPVIRASIFHGLEAFLGSQGRSVALEPLLREVGLEPAAIVDPASLIPLAPVSRLFELAGARANEPCLGLKFALAREIGDSGSIGFVLAHAPSMRVAVDNLIGFVHSFTAPLRIEFRQEENGDGRIDWMFPLEFSDVMPQWVSFGICAVIVRLRAIAGPAWVPKQVHLIHRALGCPDLARSVLGSNVTYRSAENYMVISKADMAIKASSQQEHIYRTALTAIKVEMDDLRHANDVRARVRAVIQGKLASTQVELADVAAKLGIEPRQLQSALERVGTNFTFELSDTRRQLAERLLVNTDKSMTEIAHDLGFSELSSFTRVANQWFGITPTKFRLRKRAEAAGQPPPAIGAAADSEEDWSAKD